MAAIAAPPPIQTPGFFQTGLEVSDSDTFARAAAEAAAMSAVGCDGAESKAESTAGARAESARDARAE